jgi:hypothetical protein
LIGDGLADTLPPPMRFVAMLTADQCREKASRCRKLAMRVDDGTARSLEMLAIEYDEDARLANIEAQADRKP